MFITVFAFSHAAYASPDGSLQCIEAIYQAIYKDEKPSRVPARCGLPQILPDILTTDYDIPSGLAERRKKLRQNLSAEAWARCRKEGLRYYENLSQEIWTSTPRDNPDENALADFIFSVTLEGEITSEGQRRFFANPPEPPLCLDPFLVVSVLRYRTAYIAVSENLLETLDRKELSSSTGNALWLAVLHADNTPRLQHKGAEIFLRAAKEKRFSGRRAAMLIDRLADIEGRPLVYGILYECKDGKLLPPDITDRTQLDILRAEIGLKPYEVYLKQEANKCF